MQAQVYLPLEEKQSQVQLHSLRQTNVVCVFPRRSLGVCRRFPHSQGDPMSKDAYYFMHIYRDIFYVS